MVSSSSSRSDLTALRREFAALPFADRRAVVRAVSRGRRVERRQLAVHAVVVARRQQRLWRWLWVTGPLVGLSQIPLGWGAVAVASVFATLAMVVLARFWFQRAQRAEARNLELLPKRERGRLGG